MPSLPILPTTVVGSHGKPGWWFTLVKAYAAGDEGLEGEYGVYGRIGERTWQRLLEYKWGALVGS